MTTAMPAPEGLLGYWFRFAPGRRVLHLARWIKTPSGSLLVEAACGAQVLEPRADSVPDGLLIQSTPAGALRVADQAQRRVLCRRCATVRTP